MLNCDKDNRSKTCPVLLCNFEKRDTMNTNISNRSFPLFKQEVFTTYRPAFTRNKGASNPIKAQFPKLKIIETQICPNAMNCRKNTMIPGKGNAKNYLENIDVDSELRNINRKHTRCEQRKYKPNTYSCHQFNQELKRSYEPKYKNKCGALNLRNEAFSTNSIENVYSKIETAYPGESLVKFNFLNPVQPKNIAVDGINRCTMSKRFSPCECCQNNPTHEKCKKPLTNINQDHTYNNYNILQVGPNRKNHQCELFWNNVSKRKYINPQCEHSYFWNNF